MCAKSSKDFINKLKIVEEELDESLFFIELINEVSEKQNKKLNEIYEEGDNLLAIIVKSIITSKRNLALKK
jgi:four helix bundle protein